MLNIRRRTNQGAEVIPLRVFICYSQRDAHFRKRLEVHLQPLVSKGTIEIWHDQKLTAGSRWEDLISEKLQTADMILFLLSPDFTASDFVEDREIPMALALEENGQATLVPILLKQFDYVGHELGKFTILPANGVPVNGWKKEDDAFFDISQGLMRAINHHRNLRREIANHEEPATAEDRPAAVYLIAAPENTEDVSLLVKHLRPFVLKDLFRVSDDTMLHFFGNKAENRRRAIASADLIVLLVTADLLCSGFCEDILPTILARREAEEVIVLPVLVRSCNWEATDLRKLDAFIPWDRHFLAEGSNPYGAFQETAKKIAEVVYKVVYGA